MNSVKNNITLFFDVSYYVHVICYFHPNEVITIAQQQNKGRQPQTQTNGQIRDPEVRVIGSDGAQLGIMSSREAYNLALDEELDLVKISPNANPPVCKIMDFGKFKFDQAKREKEVRKSQKVVELKEVRLGLGIGEHDYQFKLAAARKFLASGDKVKVSIRFRGREMAHQNQGVELMKRFAVDVEDLGTTSAPQKMEGRSMTMVIAPNKK